jgi:hypothetical protein
VGTGTTVKTAHRTCRGGDFKTSKSSATHGLLPTTHASCPGPISKASPGPTVISFPSWLRTAICPERTYPMWAAESLPVCLPTCRDHRHPGRYSPRPIAAESRMTAVRVLPSTKVQDLSALFRHFAKGLMCSLYLGNLGPASPAVIACYNQAFSQLCAFSSPFLGILSSHGPAAHPPHQEGHLFQVIVHIHELKHHLSQRLGLAGIFRFVCQ